MQKILYTAIRIKRFISEPFFFIMQYQNGNLLNTNCTPNLVPKRFKHDVETASIECDIMMPYRRLYNFFLSRKPTR